MASGRCWGSNNNQRDSDVNDAWGQLSLNDQMRCLNDEYEMAIDELVNNQQDDVATNVSNVYSLLQTTLDNWLTQPAKRYRCDGDDVGHSPDLLCNDPVYEVWDHLSLSDQIRCLNDEYMSAITTLESDMQINTQRINTEQTGCGVQVQARPTLDPTAPNFGLSAGNIADLVRDGGVVNDYTVVPRTRFNSIVLHRSLNLRDAPTTDLASYAVYIHNVLSEIVAFSRTLAGDGGVIDITLRGSSLTSDVNAVLSSRDGYSVDQFSDAIERVMQSNNCIKTDDSLVLTVSIAMGKNGGVRRKLRDLVHDQVIKKNRLNLFCPTNVSNNMCFAICVALFLNPHAPHNTLESIAEQILISNGYTRDHRVGFGDIGCFENKYGVKIVVFHKSPSGDLEKYQTNDKPHTRTMFLYLHDDHYYLVKNLKAFMGVPYVCRFCYKGFTNARDHSCKYSCDVCHDVMCHKYPRQVKYCDDCSRYCKSVYCYEQHKKQKQLSIADAMASSCNVTKYCKKCGRRYHISLTKPKPHKCVSGRCVHCGEDLISDTIHQCYIQPSKFKEPSDSYIFFDFETRFENGKHEANFVCAITFDGVEFTAEGSDCIDRLVKKFRNPKYLGYTWLAHNAAGFDNFLLLEYFSRVGIAVKITMMGCRLISMYDEAYKQRYIDSYSFIPMRLAKTTSAFNLTCSDKGHFPHKFNLKQNENYVGPYPGKSFYGYDTMSDKDRKEFDEWYNTVSDGVFDFKKELYVYGRNDVVLLREACIKYRDEFIQCTKLDPFNYTTLASCCMAVYKTHFLPKDTLALTHNNAYVNQHKTFSNASIEWLEYVRCVRDVDVHHALTHGEMKFGAYYVDGYYEKDGVRKVLEFNGCMHHGHECRYNPNQAHPMSKVLYGDLRKQFDTKVETLIHAYGLDVEVMWECQWTATKRCDPGVAAFMSNYSAPERLKPRDALFGGRTNAYNLHYKAKAGEKIRYLDFTSLYPFCQARKKYPVGHPEIFFKDFRPLEEYYGLVKATVYPPRKLLHPVLPYRCNGKLMFPLCRLCAEQENQLQSCTHSDVERSITGTWVSIELMKAVEKGYVVAKIHEVWHFPDSSETLFCEYVKTFLQYKLEASGYPAHVVTEEDRAEYIRDYFEKEKIQMNPDKICLNPARRSINKLLLNSLWGRFSMRENLPVSEVLTDPEQFSQHIFGDGYDIKHFSFVSDTTALIQWCYSTGDSCPTRDINVFLGAFTTAHARLELYNLMDRLGDRLLYSDTDSVIFVSREGDWEPPLGPYLGDLTDEIGGGDYITEFCSGGPKTYGYLTAGGKTCMKAKGITLNSENSKVIRLDTLIDLVDHYVVNRDSNHHILARADGIVRNKKNLTLKNKSVVKRFKVVYNKRVLLSDFSTIPYGY
ncbi:uncharacterized protein LOC143523314 isoform X1 [Brachyhypopomus gauderio]|uniref:uncharacterized protein LOC143523314 isoform X1 n=1 Tax=Brachyhypopomus gauderio TaxID=698409 RepID=UPI0040411266